MHTFGGVMEECFALERGPGRAELLCFGGHSGKQALLQARGEVSEVGVHGQSQCMPRIRKLRRFRWILARSSVFDPWLIAAARTEWRWRAWQTYEETDGVRGDRNVPPRQTRMS